MHAIRLLTDRLSTVNTTDEVVNQSFYGALPLSYGATRFAKSRRWDSNPQPPGPEPCTPDRQSVMFFLKPNEGGFEIVASSAVLIGRM